MMCPKTKRKEYVCSSCLLGSMASISARNKHNCRYVKKFFDGFVKCFWKKGEKVQDTIA